MNKKQLIIPMLGVALLGGAAVGAIGFANAQSATTAVAGETQKDFRGRGVSGTVASVSGTTITLTGSDGKTYTVDASKASLEKIQTITTSDVKAGDTLNVHGTVDGTSVSAEHIMSGKLPEGGFGGGPGNGHGRGPGVVGTVSAVSGNTLTVLGKDGTSYTVDATSAKVLKSVSGAKPTDATISSIAVGDTVGIQGTVTGTSVVANHIMDGIPPMGEGRGFGGKQPAPTATQ